MKNCIKLFITFLLASSFLFFTSAETLAAAPSNGGWTTVGSMATRRILSTSTLLQNGKVLVAGGRPSYSEAPINFTELYNPTTQTWSTTGNLNTPRLGNNILPFMVTLQNGKALIAGGGDADETSIGSAELYDPTTGVWSYTGSLNTSRRDAPVILLNDGRALIAGGATGFISGTIVATSELYDPTTGTWSYTANDLAIPRDGSTMTKLQDGRVLIVGGNQADGTCTSSAEIFDPTTNTWSLAGTMPWGAVGTTLTLLADGRVFAAGGGCATIFANTAIYDPSTNSWAATAAMPQARVGQSSFLLSDGTVLVAGGSDLATSIIYNPSTNTWSNGASLNTLRDAFTLSPLANGDMLAAGGWVSDPSQPSDTFANAELFTTVNHPPVVNPITVATSPTQVNTAITASATFTDADTTDTHTAQWNWGDGNTTTGSVTESSGSGSVSNTHTYTAAGVYPVTLTVTDNHGGTGTATYQYVVVYDASAGWVNGNKEFTSPAGAVTGNTSATGKASFGFQVKYTNGSMVPSGKNVSLSFPTGNIDFASTSYQWLVVNGSQATFKANGKLNGTSGYTVLVSAIDNGNGNATDLVRFQIKDSGGNVVYDTQPGAADTTAPTTAVTKGKITIH